MPPVTFEGRREVRADIRLLCAALRSDPEDLSRLVDRFCDPSLRQSLLGLARRERVVPALHRFLSPRLLTSFTHAEKVVMATAHEANRRRNKSIREAIVNIAAGAAHNGFRLAPLKGARWFFESSDPLASWRTMLDADLLVSPRHVDSLVEIMGSLGFQPISARQSPRRARTYRSHFHLEPFVETRTGIVVEVHRHIGFQSELLTTERMLEGADTEVPGLVLPPAWCTAFHAIIHWQSQHHGFSKMTCPAREVLELSRRLTNREVDWKRLAAHAASVGAVKECVAALTLTSELFGSAVPTPFVASEAEIRRSKKCVDIQASEYRTWVAAQRGRSLAHLQADRMKYALGRSKWPRLARVLALWLYRAVALPIAGWRAGHMLCGVLAKRVHAPWFDRFFLGRAP